MKKKICLVLPSLKVGGMERVMTELGEYFSVHKNIETHLIVMTKSDHFYAAGKNIIVHEPGFIFNTKYRMYNNFKTILFVRRTVKKLKPVAVLSFGEMYNSFVILATLKLRTKVFISDRSKPDKPWGRFYETVRKYLYPKSYGIVAQTQYGRDYLHSIIKHNNIRVIHNPVRSLHISNTPKEKIILSVGRLISTKRTDLLLEIFSKLNNPEWNLWIVGDGPLRTLLEEKAMHLGIAARVKFWGSQKNVEKFYATASIFAFTSVSEGFPNVLLEAMSAGLGCISFDCVAGPSDIIIDGVNGFLVPELDTVEYQEKLECLMLEPALLRKLSNEASGISLSSFNITKIGDQYLDFLLS